MNSNEVCIDEQKNIKEAIGLVKTQYCRHLDTKNWEHFSATLSKDICMQMGETLEGAVNGREAVVTMLQKELKNAISSPQVHDGEFTFMNDDSVTVIWPIQYIVDNKMYILNGAGFYKENYIFQEGSWRIQSWRLLRTRVDFKPKLLALRFIVFIHSIGVLKLIAPKVSLKMSQTLSPSFNVKELS